MARPTALGEVGDYTTFDLSRDGRQVVAARDRPGGSDLWVLDTTRAGLSSRLVTNVSTAAYPQWSPDGTQIAFGSVVNLFRKELTGARPEWRVTRSPQARFPLDWTPEGTSILIYELRGPTGRDLSFLPASATEETVPTPYLQTTSNEWWAEFPPITPTRWIAYQSDEPGQFEIYLDTFPTPGNRRLASISGGPYPHWGPGGREPFYVAPDNMLMAVDVTFAGDTVTTGKPRPLFRLAIVDTGRSPYRVAPDGRRFLVRAVPPQAAEPLTAIINWPALLER